MATYEQQTFLDSDPLTFSAQASRASRQVSPGSDEARQMTVGSGRQLSMLLDQSSPLGVFSRILLESPHFASSTQFCYVWRVWDTRSDFSAFQLTQLAPNTSETESLLFATPNTLDAIDPKSQEALDRERFRDNRNRTKPDNLRDQIAVKAGQRLWRTPNASEAKAGNHPAGFAMDLTDQARDPKLWPTPTANCHTGAGEHGTGAPNLQTVAKLWPTPRHEGFDVGCHNGKPDSLHAAAKLWPTATTRDWKSTSHAKTATNARPLSEVAGLTGSGSLNPRFVEELMGYPIDHTALKPLETPLSPSKRSRSSKQSR